MSSDSARSQDVTMTRNSDEHGAIESEIMNDRNHRPLLGSELENLSRKELQDLAKARGFKANLKV